MSSDLEKTSIAWKDIAKRWEEYFTPPSRPSDQESQKYEQWLSQIADDKKGQKALVLGSTPELRNALNKMGFKPHTIDINIEMIQALVDLVEHKNPEEVVVKANWLDAPLRSDYFDVILGDAVFPNVPFDQRQKFFEQICRMLKPGGYFLNRAFFAPEQPRFSSVIEALKSFSDKPPTNQSALEIVFELQLITRDPGDRLGSMQKVKTALDGVKEDPLYSSLPENITDTLKIVHNYWLHDVSRKSLGLSDGGL